MRGLLSAEAENRAGRAPFQLAACFISSQAPNIAYQSDRRIWRGRSRLRSLQVWDASSGATLERAVTSSAAAFLMLTDRGAALPDGNLEPEAFRIGYAQALQEAEDICLAWTS
jgi:hypothetical protein